MADKLRVGVLGAGAWAELRAHPRLAARPALRGRRDLRSASASWRSDFAAEFGIPEATNDWQALVGARRHRRHRRRHAVAHALRAGLGGARGGQARAVREAGRLRLPRHAARGGAGQQQGPEDQARLHLPLQPRRAVRQVADRRGLRRHAVHLQRLRAELAVARPADPAAPGAIPTPTSRCMQVSSLEGYGAPIIDIGHWWVGADYSRVVGTMRNFIPERMVRATGQMMRMNIDDGDIFIGEFANGAIGSIQTSFVTVGNYPGIEARIYGEKGAIICRLVEEFGVAETIKVATPDEVEFQRARDPAALLSARRARARVVAHAVLRQPDQRLHRRDPRGRRAQPGQLRRRRLGAGSDQRRRAVVPRAPLGRSAARQLASHTVKQPEATRCAEASPRWTRRYC